MNKQDIVRFRKELSLGVSRFQAWGQRVWFKLAILLVLATVFHNKDFSFHLNMNAPDSSVFTGSTVVPSSLQEKHEQEMIDRSGLIPDQEKKGHSREKPLTPAERKHLASQQAYIGRFADVAQAEMRKFGIPASITLAQGLLESNAGQSRLAKENNNHFGIKCFSKRCKKGHCSNFSDDHHKDFFRKYDTAWSSFRHHSQLLLSDHYKHLAQHGKNYREWAVGLKKAGYATSPTYAEKLIRLIEVHQLDQYDQ